MLRNANSTMTDDMHLSQGEASDDATSTAQRLRHCRVELQEFLSQTCERLEILSAAWQECRPSEPAQPPSVVTEPSAYDAPPVESERGPVASATSPSHVSVTSDTPMTGEAEATQSNVAPTEVPRTEVDREAVIGGDEPLTNRPASGGRAAEATSSGLGAQTEASSARQVPTQSPADSISASAEIDPWGADEEPTTFDPPRNRPNHEYANAADAAHPPIQRADRTAATRPTNDAKEAGIDPTDRLAAIKARLAKQIENS